MNTEKEETSRGFGLAFPKKQGTYVNSETGVLLTEDEIKQYKEEQEKERQRGYFAIFLDEYHEYRIEMRFSRKHSFIMALVTLIKKLSDNLVEYLGRIR